MRKGGEGKRRHVSVQWKLFLTLIFFTCLLLSSIWVVQIRLLGFFYERETKAELADIATQLSGQLDEATLASTVESLGKEKQTCIRVFRVGENSFFEIGSVDTVGGCFLHHMQGDILQKIYDETLKNGGTYTVRKGLPAPDSSEDFRVPGLEDEGTTGHVIHAGVYMTDAEEYFVMLDAKLTPVAAIVNTLQMQFLWISVAMLVFALFLAFVLSRIVTRPLRVITEQAGQLAEGNYRAEFKGKGYREVEELAEVLNFAATEIGKTDTLQKELIANVSHDLRTPLTMIRGYGEMMRDIPGEVSPENLKVIIDETARLEDLVNALMDLSKLKSSSLHPDRAAFDMTEMLREALARYVELIRPRGFRVEYRLTDAPALVFADRGMLLQVLYNLMNNAANYTGEDMLITVTEEVASGRVRISVRDTGEGIAPELIPQIWDRYYRVDKLHKRAAVGTGLGLSIVKEALEKHGALYGVESAVGVGSVFWFELILFEGDPSEN